MSDERFNQFESKVRKLWPRYRTTSEEIRVRVWTPRLSKLPPDVVGHALQKHAAAHPDNDKPNWTLIYREIGSRRGGSMSEFDALILGYRKHKDPAVRRKFVDKTDAEVWAYFVEANIYPIMFGYGGRFRQDIDRAVEFAKREIETLVRVWGQRIQDAGDEVPSWLADVGIPARWLEAARAKV